MTERKKKGPSQPQKENEYKPTLTKKDLPRGMYRHLTEQEVSFLKMSKSL